MRFSTVWYLSLHTVCLIMLGCTLLPATTTAPAPAVMAAGEPGQDKRLQLDRADLRAILAYYRRVKGMDEKSLQQELAEARQELAVRARPVDQIRLAILLSLPSAPFQDYDRALGLLDDAAGASNADDQTVSDLLYALSSMLAELKGQWELYQKLDLKFREERKQRELLQQKLDELTTIEKNLLERGPQQTP
jgi:hypothetical protein